MRGPFEQHAANARVDRQARQLAADVGHRTAALYRTQLLQQGKTVADRAPVGWLDKRKVLDSPQTQMQHLQDHGSQVGAANFRVGKLRPAVKVVLAVQAHADAGCHPTAAALTLIGAGLRDCLHGQPLHLGARAVTADARLSRINHINDTRHGQRGFRHVGGQHYAPPGVGGKDLLLLGGRQARVQRQNLGVLEVGLAQVLGGVANLPLTRQEHQHIARRLALTAFKLLNLAQRRDNALIDTQVILNGIALLVALGTERAIPDIHRVGATRHLDHRSVVEVRREALQVDGRRGNDHLEIRAFGQNGLEVTQQKIDVQAALVGLVDDQRVVTVEIAVVLGFSQQNTVGHQLDQRALGGLIGKTHLIAHQLAQRCLQLFGNARGHAAGRQPARLGVADQAVRTAPQFQADLGQLSGFTRAGFTGNHHHLMLGNRRLDLFALVGNRQCIGVDNLGDQPRTFGYPLAGSVKTL